MRAGAWAAGTFEAKRIAGEISFSAIRRPIVVLWAKNRRENEPPAELCSPDGSCRPRSQARVAEPVDAGDLKSPGSHPCGFDSRPAHQSSHVPAIAPRYALVRAPARSGVTHGTGSPSALCICLPGLPVEGRLRGSI